LTQSRSRSRRSSGDGRRGSGDAGAAAASGGSQQPHMARNFTTGHIRSTAHAAMPPGMLQHGWSVAGVAPPHGLQQQQQHYVYPPYAMMGGGWYPYAAYGMPGAGPAAAAGAGLSLRRGGSGSSRQRAAAALDAEGRRVRHGVLQRSHSL
jgi:hypothetical protein